MLQTIFESEKLRKTESLELLSGLWGVIQQLRTESSCSEQQPRCSPAEEAAPTAEEAKSAEPAEPAPAAEAAPAAEEAKPAEESKPAEKTKVCRDCHKALRLKEFSRNSSRCKPCKSAYKSAYSATRKDGGNVRVGKDPCLVVEQRISHGALARLRPSAAAAQVAKGAQPEDLACAFEKNRADGKQCTGLMSIITSSAWKMWLVDEYFDMKPWHGQPCCAAHR